MNFNFPPTKFVETNRPAQQLEHVLSEIDEIFEELRERNHDQAVTDYPTLCELVDLTQSLETFWRVMARVHGDLLVKALFAAVESKTHRKGYYNGPDKHQSTIQRPVAAG
jgi:hypothetical protein